MESEKISSKISNYLYQTLNPIQSVSKTPCLAQSNPIGDKKIHCHTSKILSMGVVEVTEHGVDCHCRTGNNKSENLFSPIKSKMKVLKKIKKRMGLVLNLILSHLFKSLKNIFTMMMFRHSLPVNRQVNRQHTPDNASASMLNLRGDTTRVSCRLPW
uniref:CSON006798 protein n=1 Tax=Culicoides sonorensis TaxID=179676 RepID=A0A336MW01_CULSO